METEDVRSPRCAGERRGAAQDGREAGGGNRSANDDDCSWQMVAARRSIEHSWSMLGARSQFSAGDGAAAGSVHGEWDGTPSANVVSKAELLAKKEQNRNNRFILFVFCIIFLLEVFVNFDSGVIPAVLVTLQRTFAMDGAAAGLLGSLPYIGLVASSPFVGRGLTAFSPKWFCFITMIVNLFATGLLGLAVRKWMLFLSRLLIGLSQAGFSIYAPVWVDQFAPAEKLTLWMGLAQGGVVVGTMLGCILAGTFDSASAAEGGSSGWRYAVLIQAICLSMLLLAWVALPRRFVDINMQQTTAAETRADGALEPLPSGEAPPGGKEKEDEEQATGVEGTAESPQKAEATMGSNISRASCCHAAVEQTEMQQPSHQQGPQQQPHDTVVVISSTSKTPQHSDVQLAAGVPGKTEREGVAAAAAAESNADDTATVVEIRSSGRRRSTAGARRTTDAAAHGEGEATEERRWSAFAGVAPAALFARKGNKRPFPAAGALALSVQGAAAANRPSSKTLSDEGDPASSNSKKTQNRRHSQAPRYLQSGDAGASTEGLPQFRRNFVSNLLPLDFIATSPTFARRSSQLHPGPAPGAAAAAAAGLTSSGNSSCSSSSVGSPRKEIPRGAGNRGLGNLLAAHRRSSSILGAAGGKIAPAGAAATAAQRKKQQGKAGSSTDQLRLPAGGGVGVAEVTLPAATGEGELGPRPAFVDVSAAAEDDVSSDSASAAPPRSQQQQQAGRLLLGLNGRPLTENAAAPVPAGEQKRALTAVSSRSVSAKTAGRENNAAAVAAPLGGAAAVEDVIPGSTASCSSSKVPRHDSGIDGASTAVTGRAAAADVEAPAAASHILSYSHCCAASAAATPSAAGPATESDSSAAAARGEAAHTGATDRRESAGNGCSMRAVTVGSEQQQRAGGADMREGDVAAAVAAAAVGRGRRASASGGATDAPGGLTGAGGLAGAAPGVGVNEVQYQRIFMTPHASTLAFEAFNWAAGVADPLLLVRDNCRHYSVGGGSAAGGNGTTVGSTGLPADLSLADAAHPIAVQVARRRRSTTGATAVFTRSAGRASTAAAVAAAVPRKVAPAESAEAPTVAGDDSVILGAAEAADVDQGGRRAAPKKTAQKIVEENRQEQYSVSEQRKLVVAGGEATAGEQAAEPRLVANLKDGELLGKEDVEEAAAAAAASLGAGGEQLQDKASTLLREGSLATLAREPRTFDVWQSIRMLFSSPLYICVTISLCALFFEVTAIQFWSISYFEEALQVSKGQVLVAFNVTAATGPILGVVAGGWFIDFVGGYKTARGMMKTLLILGAWATVCLVFGTFACWVPSFTATIAFIWGILFFGGCILPAATGIVIASVPLEVRAFGSGFCMMIYNVFGYVLGTAVPGAVVQAAGLTWAMRMVFLWSIFGVGGLFAAAFVVWQLRIRPSYYICTYGVDGQEQAEPVTNTEECRHNSRLRSCDGSASAAVMTNGPVHASETRDDAEASSCTSP